MDTRPKGYYEIGMHSFEIYYSFPNVDNNNNNNQRRVSLDDGKSWALFTLPIGSYEHKAVSLEIQRQMVIIGGKKDDLFKPTKTHFKL